MPCHFQNTQYSLELKMKILHSNDFTLYMKVPLEKCGGQPRSIYRFYYTSEEFFLYKITVDKRTIHHFSRQNELLTGT